MYGIPMNMYYIKILNNQHPFYHQYTNTAILKMKHRVQADIIVDGWPEFNCTAARLPESEEVLLDTCML